MSTKLTREAYQKLIDEDRAWLAQQPRTLEREHIDEILRHAVEYEYACKPDPALKTFPVLGHGFSVPWHAMEAFEVQAKRNHNQTLSELAARGGLDPQELWAVCHEKHWTVAKLEISHDDAERWARKLITAPPAPAKRYVGQSQCSEYSPGPIAGYDTAQRCRLQHGHEGWHQINTFAW